MTLDSWTTRISAATTDEHVVEIAREYLGSLAPGFLSRLPPACQPPEMRSAQDVSSYAYVLMHRGAGRDGDPVLVDMNRFFAAASQRVCVLLMPRGHFTPRPQRDFG